MSRKLIFRNILAQEWGAGANGVERSRRSEATRTRSLSGLGFRIHSEWISSTILVRRELRIEIRGDRGAEIGPKDARMDRKAFGRKSRAVILGAQGLSSVGP